MSHSGGAAASVGGGAGAAAAGRRAPNPRAEILRLAERRQELENDLDSLENQIFNYETTYLKETPYGNVVRGWNAYKNPNTQPVYEVKESERLFSRSSVTSVQIFHTDPPCLVQHANGASGAAAASSIGSRSSRKKAAVAQGSSTDEDEDEEEEEEEED